MGISSVLRNTIKTLKKKPNFSKSNNQIFRNGGRNSKWRSVNSLGYINSEESIKPQYAVQRLYELTKIKILNTTEVQHQMWAARIINLINQTDG